MQGGKEGEVHDSTLGLIGNTSMVRLGRLKAYGAKEIPCPSDLPPDLPLP